MTKGIFIRIFKILWDDGTLHKKGLMKYGHYPIFREAIPLLKQRGFNGWVTTGSIDMI